MFRYLFEDHPEVLDDFRKHLYLRSVAEAFSKLLVFSTDELGDNKYKEERLKLMDSVFEMLTPE